MFRSQVKKVTILLFTCDKGRGDFDQVYPSKKSNDKTLKTSKSSQFAPYVPSNKTNSVETQEKSVPKVVFNPEPPKSPIGKSTSFTDVKSSFSFGNKKQKNNEDKKPEDPNIEDKKPHDRKRKEQKKPENKDETTEQIVNNDEKRSNKPKKPKRSQSHPETTPSNLMLPASTPSPSPEKKLVVKESNWNE